MWYTPRMPRPKHDEKPADPAAEPPLVEFNVVVDGRDVTLRARDEAHRDDLVAKLRGQ